MDAHCENVYSVDGRLIFQDRYNENWASTERLYPVTDAAGNVTTLLTKQANDDYLPGKRYVYKVFGELNSVDVGLSCPDAVSYTGAWNYLYKGAYHGGSERSNLIHGSEYYLNGRHYDPFMGSAIPIAGLSGGYTESNLEVGEMTWLENTLVDHPGWSYAAAVGGCVVAGLGIVAAAGTVAEVGLASYLSTQAGISAFETGTEMIMRGGEGDIASIFGKNLAINILTGGIGGGMKGAGRYGMWAVRQSIEIGADTAYDIGIYGMDFRSSLLVNSAGSIGGELLFKGFARGAGAAFRRLRRGARGTQRLAYDISDWGDYGLPSDAYFVRTITREQYLELKAGRAFSFGGKPVVPEYPRGMGFIGAAEDVRGIMTSAGYRAALNLDYDPKYVLEFQLRSPSGLQNVLSAPYDGFVYGGKTATGFREWNLPGISSADIVNPIVRILK